MSHGSIEVTLETVSGPHFTRAGEQVAQALVGEAVDADQPLAAQGLDSLAAMELRQKLQVRPVELIMCTTAQPNLPRASKLPSLLCNNVPQA